MENYDVIIIGGSYSGLAASMALGRALKNVLIIDEGKPCNRQTAYSHNFLTHDGNTPAAIASSAKLQVEQYATVKFLKDRAVSGAKKENGFEIHTSYGETFGAKKLIIATGIKDLHPNIPGFDDCWGITVLHCPYCHGYEVRGEKTGILSNGDPGFDFMRLISNWTNDLTLFTNGAATLTGDQREQLERKNINIIETPIDRIEHETGHLTQILFKDGTKFILKVLYAPGPFEQQGIVQSLGCELTEERFISVDSFMETTVKGVFACGDNSSHFRTVANAIAMGTAAGITASKRIIFEEF